MEARFNVQKEERKALVAAVSEITSVKAEYQGAPSFAFRVNGHFVDKYGTIAFYEQTDAADIRALLTALAERGFVPEGGIDEIAPVAPVTEDAADVLAERTVISGEVDSDTPVSCETVPDEDAPAAASVVETSDTLVIEMPLDGFTRTALDNLEKMVTSKASLILKAIGVPESDAGDDLPISQTENKLQFPWFPLPASKDEIDAYGKFVCALCDLAKKQKRVTMKDSDVDSEKFAMRCFLLRLGFIGDEYKSARRILLSKLSGNGSFKSGDHKKPAAPETVTAADSGANDEGGGVGGESGESADNAVTGGGVAVTRPRCDKCQQHCYYTDGMMRTSAGDIVDTSNRTPDKYTHYCLAAPSGFRRIKHASEWSGCETAPKWCPLNRGN